MPGKRKTKTLLEDPASGWLEEAVKTLTRGGLVAFPTETFYGIAADPSNKAALKRLFTLKKRPSTKPFPLIIKDMEMLSRLVGPVPAEAARLIERFWPGPLTIIFRAKDAAAEEAAGGSAKIGLRISSGAVCKRLLEKLNFPVTATSANPAGKPPARSASDVIKYFNGEIDLIIIDGDGGRLQGGLASTVVDVTGDGVEVVREGVVPANEIFDTLKPGPPPPTPESKNNLPA